MKVEAASRRFLKFTEVIVIQIVTTTLVPFVPLFKLMSNKKGVAQGFSVQPH